VLDLINRAKFQLDREVLKPHGGRKSLSPILTSGIDRRETFNTA